MHSVDVTGKDAGTRPFLCVCHREVESEENLIVSLKVYIADINKNTVDRKRRIAYTNTVLIGIVQKDAK